jgi:hypothetical protein
VERSFFEIVLTVQGVLMLRKSMGVLILALAATTSGCGSNAAAQTDGSDAGAHDDGPSPTPTTWTGSVYEAKSAEDGGTIPIVNGRVCLLDHPEVACSGTDTSGKWSIELPPADGMAQYAITFSASQHLGYTSFGTVSPGSTITSSWPSGVGLEADDWAINLATQAGFTYPAQGTAFVDVRLLNGSPRGLDGATVTLSSAAKGPVYENTMLALDPSLTSTSAEGVAWFGNVPPGEFTVTVHSTTATCTTQGIEGLWPEVASNVVKAEVGPDTMVRVEMFCR